MPDSPAKWSVWPGRLHKYVYKCTFKLTSNSCVWGRRNKNRWNRLLVEDNVLWFNCVLYFSPSAIGTEHAETLEMDDSEGRVCIMYKVSTVLDQSGEFTVYKMIFSLLLFLHWFGGSGHVKHQSWSCTESACSGSPNNAEKDLPSIC